MLAQVKTDQADVNEDGNLPYWQSSTDRHVGRAPQFIRKNTVAQLTYMSQIVEKFSR